jgi:hypothetical protein
VPIFILMKKGTPLDGSAPLLLYGYGSYGIAMEPSFSIRNLSAWSIAAGSGPRPARAAARKRAGAGSWTARRTRRRTPSPTSSPAPNTCTRPATASPANTVAYGGSAGGLLMGAITNMRPDLFAGIIAAVPFVDVVNTMSDTSLPLTPPEWPEWGNPLEDAAAYDYIASYSPYDNVEAKPYPAVLATGGLSDPRVTYWEPEKWVAKLRPATTSGKPVLLKINMDAGHGGASGRFDFLKEIAWTTPSRCGRWTRAGPRRDGSPSGEGVAEGGISQRWRRLGRGSDDRSALHRRRSPRHHRHLCLERPERPGHLRGGPARTGRDGPPPQGFLDRGLPYLVAELDGEVVGYCYAGPFRLRAAYRYTVEDSVYVSPKAVGKGVGKALLAALIVL